MKLYEVNLAIEALFAQLEPDPETGEIPMEADAILWELSRLQMERSRILEYLAKLVLNTRSEAASLKDEESRLRDRRRSLERKDERIMAILDRECGGIKTDCGVATISYRRTEKVDVADSTAAVQWLRENSHTNCYRVPEPEVNKTEVKKLIKSGEAVPGIALVQDVSCSLR
jgi:hypothetical protein